MRFFSSIFSKRIGILTILAIFLFVLLLSLNSNFHKKNSDLIFLTQKCQSVIFEKEKKSEQILDVLENLLPSSNSISLFSNIAFLSFCQEHEIFTAVYINDSLCFWSDNSLPVSNSFDSSMLNSKFSKIGNTYSLLDLRTIDSIRLLSAVVLSNRYNFQNDYLINGFLRSFQMPSSVSISTLKNGNDIFSSSGEYLFSLNIKKVFTFSPLQEFLLFLVYIMLFASITILIFLSLRQAPWLKHRPNIFILFFSVILILLRGITLYFHLPSFLYSTKLFGPLYFAASEFLPSLGDLFLNSLVFLSICWAFYRYTIFPSKTGQITAFSRISIALLVSVFCLIIFIYFQSLLRSIIIDSTISYNLNNIFSLNHLSSIGFIIVCFLLLSFILLILRANTFIFSLLPTIRSYSIFSVLFTISGLLFFAFFWRENVFTFILFLSISISGWYFRSRSYSRISLSELVLYLLIITFFATYTFYKSNDFKEKEKRKSLAQKLTSGQDPVAEYLYSSLVNNIQTDHELHELLAEYPATEIEIKELITKRYFVGYWDRYKIQITVCNQGDSLIIEPSFTRQVCSSFFESLIADIGKPTLTQNLTCLNYGGGGNNYLSRIDFQIDTITTTSVFIEMNSKFIPRGLGYPELLLDKKLFLNSDLSNYSYAKYKNGELLDAYGKYLYSLTYNDIDSLSGDYSFYNTNGYNHLLYKSSEGILLILSRKNGNLLDLIAPFSFLFVFFIFILGVFYLIINLPPKRPDFQLNFKNRLQISIVSIIFFSFIIIGIATIVFIQNLNENKNMDILNEKSMSVLTEIQAKISDFDTLAPEQEAYLTNLLVKFSNVFFTDINLFNLNGDLIASSRSQIFSEGLLSGKINPVAYNELLNQHKTLYIHKEKIGTLEYYSAYVPFYNNKNSLVALLNMPYFAKENELKNELSSFLMAFINIYVFLMAIAVIIALFVSTRTARPLNIIREKISRVKLGRKNEKLIWNRNDEIGNLINEYNRMIDELSRSAELLAQSERESAWREMAQQVAHEIKNPLTPMKLSVQHLERAWKDHVPDWEQRLDRFSKTIIAQIDNLSAIAGEFSDFAKMPKSVNEQLNLISIINYAIGLFSDSQKVRIVFDHAVEADLPFFGDPGQLLRVMNNLLKNSIQAIEDVQKGHIIVSAARADAGFMISITDNGCGIPDEMKPRIFMPNFSTKTDGMGLGLAMVKNIIENASGKIWFESAEGKGTVFYIWLPETTES